jgi:23S rRNA (cytosine1962-C5)-methyltransferase
MYKKITLKKDRLRNIQRGHPWIFSNGIESSERIHSGELCEIFCAGKFIGVGYYNAETDIAIRFLTTEKKIIDEKFFIERLKKLRDQKQRFIKNTNAYRLVFGESDNLSGLIIDLYDTVAVLQYHTLGIEKLSPYIVGALKKIIKPTCIYLKDSVHSRKAEGLASENKVLFGKLPEEVIIEENGFKFAVNIAHGQKTGFFLDQRQNRLNLIPYVKNARVLNCFSYTGGFSIYAASVAKSVTSVDISQPAIDAAKKNFELNGFDPDKHEFIAADVFDYLKTIDYGKYDVIILDPPSFARKRNQLTAAIKAYNTINSKALEKMKPGGILVSSSCTAHVDELTFLKILHQASVNTNCQLKVLHSATQPIDHAYNLNFPEGRYLKYFILLKD